jgi:hypothetical protein
MKSLYKILTLFVAGTVLLAGCGTKQETEKTATTPNTNTASTQDNSSTDNSNKDSSVSTNNNNSTDHHNIGTDSPNTDHASQTEAKPPTKKKLSYTKDGKTYEETGKLETSENQSFSLYVLGNWKLEAEEPNSDVLLKDRSFVRIRLVQPDDNETDYAKMVEDQAKAVTSDAVQQETNNLQGMLHQAVWYKAYTNDTAVNVLWIKGNVPMIVNIQTPRNQEVLEPIFAMLETIQKLDTSQTN